MLLAGCGGATTPNTGSSHMTEAADRSAPPAWQQGTSPPKVSAALIAQAGDGLTSANTKLGTLDEVLGSVAAGAHVDPSTKHLNHEYERFGRCIGEQLRIHDPGHELALLSAYNRKDRAAQAGVNKSSLVCEGFAITPDAGYRQSLTTNP
jgi:hypothetical protein